MCISARRKTRRKPSFLKERFEAVGIENTITAANCAEEDWINNWKKYFKPIPVGNRLLVRPMWEDEYEAGDRVVRIWSRASRSVPARMKRPAFAWSCSKSM